MGDKFVDTLSSKGVTLENKTIHTRPLSPTFKVEESVVVSYRHSSSNSSIPLNGGGGGGRGGRQSLSKALVSQLA